MVPQRDVGHAVPGAGQSWTSARATYGPTECGGTSRGMDRAGGSPARLVRSRGSSFRES
jgi:hypothetical protein